MKKLEVSAIYFYIIHIVLFIAILSMTYGFTNSKLVFFSIFSNDDKIITIAHRGASGYAPEHTLAAYRTGIRMEADYIEIDIQMTKDGVIIAMHDETLNRTTSGYGRVENRTLEEIKKLNAGSWFNKTYPIYAREEYLEEKVPTLREIFETFGKDTQYLLETKAPEKNPGVEAAMWELIEEFDLKDHVAVQSFSKSSLRLIKELDPDIKLFQLIWYERSASISNARLSEISSYADGIGANFSQINESYVHRVKNAGLLIYPYTVNYQLNMDKALKWGADGIHTNYPDRFAEVIEQYKNPEF